MKIQKERMTVCDTKDNLIETEKGITCGCGNSISMECKRDEEDSMY